MRQQGLHCIVALHQSMHVECLSLLPSLNLGFCVRDRSHPTNAPQLFLQLLVFPAVPLDNVPCNLDSGCVLDHDSCTSDPQGEILVLLHG